jgi:hypothetical protein
MIYAIATMSLFERNEVMNPNSRYDSIVSSIITIFVIVVLMCFAAIFYAVLFSIYFNIRTDHCPINNVSDLENVDKCLKSKKIIRGEDLEEFISERRSPFGFHSIEYYRKALDVGCFRVEKNEAIALLQDNTTVFYTTVYSLVQLHESMIRKGEDYITASMYSDEKQPCICSLKYLGDVVHIINPNVLNFSVETNRIIENVVFGNLEESKITQEIPKSMELSWKNLIDWKETDVKLTGLDVNFFFKCLLHLGSHKDMYKLYSNIE